MSLTISVRFLTGRAHLHPWQTHHSEGRVDWPPSPWRLLRAILAVAGRGLTSLPFPDFVSSAIASSAIGGKPVGKNKHAGEATVSTDYWQDQPGDLIPISRLAAILPALASTPTIWLPKSSGGHTRQYFPIHEGGIVKNTGSTVFDTFAVIRKDQPLLFHWPGDSLDDRQLGDLELILSRTTYFGRAESWCQAEAHVCEPEEIDGVCIEGRCQTHWPCVCIEHGGKPAGREYREYTLERRLASLRVVKTEAVDLLPRTKTSEGKDRKATAETFRATLETDPEERLLLRCLLRESGQDIKDGLERPIGTAWVHYSVPRAVHQLSHPAPVPRRRNEDPVKLVRYALNTATVQRPVLPPLTDVLLVADHFRSAVMALARQPSRALSGHDANGDVCREHDHAFWWPVDEDNDGFLDHVNVYAPGGFGGVEVDALRRLTRIRQRGGRTDLLVTPIYLGCETDYRPWRPCRDEGTRRIDQCTNLFVSVTPYYCPVSLSRGKKSRASRPHSIKKEMLKGLRQQRLIGLEDEVEIQELVFDYAPSELQAVEIAISEGQMHPPCPPRQFFPVVEAPAEYPALPTPGNAAAMDIRYKGCAQKDPDEQFTFGIRIGLYVGGGERFVPSLGFCRRRRNHQVRGPGRMFCLAFRDKRPPQPFAIGDQCHFGLGLFLPVDSV